MTANEHEAIFKAGEALGYRVGYAEGRADRLIESLDAELERARAVRRIVEQDARAFAGRIGRITEFEAVEVGHE